MTEPNDNARARFYLEHRAVIEQWAALRGEGRELIEAALFDLEDPLEALASREGAELLVDVEESRPSLTLYLPSWQSSQAVRVSVGLCWERRRLLVPGPYNEWAWVGVWVADDAFRRREQLVSALKKLRTPHNFTTSPGWVLWRYVLPDAGVLDPDAYANAALRQVEAAWTTTRDVVETALA